MTKYWPTIKLVLPRLYLVLLWLLVVANAYAGQRLSAFIFLIFIALDVLDRGIDKIAEAIRTQRNFHIIGDANEIHLKGSSVFADSIHMSERKSSPEATQ